MSTQDSVYKDMMEKFKESFSSKSFKSKSYQTSLIRNSKTFRLDVNLVATGVHASENALSGSTFNAKNTVRKKESTSIKDANLVNTKHGNLRSLEHISPKVEANENVANSGAPLKTSTEHEDLKLKHSIQTLSNYSFNKDETKAKEIRSDFESLRCDVCLKYFSSKLAVKRHSPIHSLERHVCETCGRVFPTKDKLKGHCRRVHELIEKSIKCSRCFKAYSKKSELNIHFKRHPDHVLQSS